MLGQMVLGAGMIVVTTFIQGVFTVVGIQRLRAHLARGTTTKSLVRSTLTIAVFVLWLFLATILQVWAWGTLYLVVGALNSIETAVYFSTVTFTTLGFGDVTLDENWRLLSAFEGANGLLMFGWSTALIFAAVQWVYGRDRKPSGSRSSRSA
jgi:ion channel